MTQQQKASVDKLREEYNTSCGSYVEFGSTEYCSFSVFENKRNPKDNNIVVSMNVVSGLNEDSIPMTANKKLLIEPDGNIIPLHDIITDYQLRLEYFSRLTKLND